MDTRYCKLVIHSVRVYEYYGERWVIFWAEHKDTAEGEPDLRQVALPSGEPVL